MKRADKEWQNCLSTTIKLKFENLRTHYMVQMEELMNEIKKERQYRKIQCHKSFEQWKEDMMLQCTLETSEKLPNIIMRGQSFSLSRNTEKQELLKQQLELEKIDEENLIKINIQNRLRNPSNYLDCEAAFNKEFQLVDNFTGKYTYFMQGKAKDIQRQIQLLKERLEQYISLFSNRLGDTQISGGKDFAGLEKIKEESSRNLKSDLGIYSAQSLGPTTPLSKSSVNLISIKAQKHRLEHLKGALTQKNSPKQRLSIACLNSVLTKTIGLPSSRISQSQSDIQTAHSQQITPKQKNPQIPVHRRFKINSGFNSAGNFLSLKPPTKTSKAKRIRAQKYMVNPQTIPNQHSREVKIKLLLRKPFDLTDDHIGRQNKQISEDAYANAGHSFLEPRALLPKTAFLAQCNLAIPVQKKNHQKQDAEDLQRKTIPLIRKGLRKQDSLDRLEEEPAEHDISSDFIVDTSENSAKDSN